MESIVNVAIEHGLGGNQSKCDIVDAFSDSIWSRELGHELSCALQSIWHKVFRTQKHEVINSNCTWATMAIRIRRPLLIGNLDGSDGCLWSTL